MSGMRNNSNMNANDNDDIMSSSTSASSSYVHILWRAGVTAAGGADDDTLVVNNKNKSPSSRGNRLFFSEPQEEDDGSDFQSVVVHMMSASIAEEDEEQEEENDEEERMDEDFREAAEDQDDDLTTAALSVGLTSSSVSTESTCSRSPAFRVPKFIKKVTFPDQQPQQQQEQVSPRSVASPTVATREARMTTAKAPATTPSPTRNENNLLVVDPSSGDVVWVEGTSAKSCPSLPTESRRQRRRGHAGLPTHRRTDSFVFDGSNASIMQDLSGNLLDFGACQMSTGTPTPQCK